MFPFLDETDWLLPLRQASSLAEVRALSLESRVREMRRTKLKLRQRRVELQREESQIPWAILKNPVKGAVSPPLPPLIKRAIMGV